MKYILLLLTALTISGCATCKDSLITEKLVNIDKLLLVECTDLAAPTGTSFEEVLFVTKDNLYKYKECRTKHNALTILVKDFANIVEGK